MCLALGIFGFLRTRSHRAIDCGLGSGKGFLHPVAPIAILPHSIDSYQVAPIFGRVAILIVASGAEDDEVCSAGERQESGSWGALCS